MREFTSGLRDIALSVQDGPAPVAFFLASNTVSSTVVHGIHVATFLKTEGLCDDLAAREIAVRS